MKHCLTFALCLAGLASVQPVRAAIWMDRISGFTKVSSAPIEVQNRPLWEEYGLLQAEQAEYSGKTGSWKVTAWHMKDSTGAFAAFQMTRPDGFRLSSLTDAAIETQNGVRFVFGNYLLAFEGWKPKIDEVALFMTRLPGLDRSPLPSKYLPAKGLVPNSERYLLGPVGLEQIEKGVPPAVAAFSMGAEVQVGQYDTPAGRMQLAVFSYPTPQIARLRLDEFTKISGAMAKRTGPLVAVLLAPKDPNEAERLLAGVRFNAVITENQRKPSAKDNVGDLMVNIFILVGIILAVIIPAGLMVGVARRLGWGTSGEAMTVLHLGDRRAE